MRILISDDSRFSAVLLTKTLEKNGHEVIVAHNGAEAWARLQQEDVSLVISDWIMPEMDGLELCRRIRRRQKGSYIYVILLTTKHQQSDRLEALAAGIDDFLVKPLDEPELLARLAVAQRILRMKEDLEIRAAELKEQNAYLTEAMIYSEVANHRFAQLFEGLPVACFAYDETGHIQDWNRVCEEVFGRSAGQVLQQPAWSLFGDHDEAERMKQVISRVLGGEALHELEQSIVRPDGTVRHVRSSTFPLPGGNCDIVGAISVSVDITERKAKEEALARSEELYRTLAHNFPDGAILLFDRELRYTVADGVGLEALGLFPEMLLGKTLWDVFPPELCGTLSRHYRAALEGRESRFEMAHADRTHLVHTLPVKNARGEIFAGMVLTQDITDQKRYEQQIEEQMTQSQQATIALERQREELEAANLRLSTLVTTDSLTGAKSSRAFQECLEEHFQRAIRSLATVSLILIDVDDFKAYNLGHGHPAGDTALRTIATLLQENARSTDLVARIGGDEFAIVLPDTDKDGALWMGERLRQAIEGAAISPSGITISVGLSSVRPATRDVPQLIQEAEDALGSSKQSGRNCVTHAEDIHASTYRRAQA